MLKFVENHKKKINQGQTHMYCGGGKKIIMSIGEEDMEELYNLITEGYKNGKKDQNSFTEKIIKEKNIRFYIDIDFEIEDFGDSVTAEEIKEKMKKINEKVKETVEKLTGDEPEMIIANRLKYKEHLYFPKLIVNQETAKELIKELIKEFKKSEEMKKIIKKEKIFDSSVYSTGLRMLYCNKGSLWNGKEEKLKKEQEEHKKIFGEGDWNDYYKIVDRNLEELEQGIEDLRRTRIVTTEEITYEFKREEVTKKERREIERRQNWKWIEVAKYLEEKGGRKEVRCIGETEMGYNYECNRTEPCFCNGYHTSNNWYVIILPTCMLTGNYSPKCHTHKIEVNEQKFDDFMTMITEEHEYAVIFAEKMKKEIRYTGDTKQGFMTCEKGYWESLNRTRLQCMLKDMFKPMLDKLQNNCLWNYMYYEHLAGERKLTEEEEKIRKQSKIYKEQALKGRKYIRNQRNTLQLIEACKETLLDCDLLNKLDKRQNLFAFTNKICDLNTLEIRNIEPEDMISLTTGYDYDEHIDIEIQEEFEEFLRQIYPIDDEREFIQTYFGYCLRGDHPEKILLFLTDTRNGYNGKSTIGKMICKTWGEYAISGNKELLYKRDKYFETENSHQSGKLMYEKKRIATFEELDPERRLNNELIKEYNGSDYKLPVRQANSSETKEMAWTAKMIMMFNGMKLPKFDIDDKALIQRMVTIQHRSKFVFTQEELDDERNLGHEFTYLANTEIEHQLEKWKSYFFRWCLEGLKMYQEHRFNKKPQACKQWKQELLQTQNVVQEFIDRFVEKSNDTNAFIKQKDIWERYEIEYREYERNAKTKIGKHKFCQRLSEIMPNDTFKQVHWSEKTHKNVWIGYRWNQTEEKELE